MSRHGEFKTPGGKLVVIDLELEGGRLSRVELSGDFFLEPPEALEAIVAALEGAPAASAEAELAARVRAALPEHAEMIGFDPEAVATAVTRAVVDGSPRELA